MRETKHGALNSSSIRYLGLELAGAKNQKTAVAALEFYPREKKIFLLDIFDRIAVRKASKNHSHLQTNDEALLELIDEMKPGVAKLGVNVPLQLPPCITCTKKSCHTTGQCGLPEVKWMREAVRKAGKLKDKSTRVKEFTPYTQRPVELYIRYQVLPLLPDANRFEIDETLGGNKAPLTARAHYLQKRLEGVPLVEVWPKLTVAILAIELELSKRVVSSYRHLEQGVYAREEILETLAARHGIFIYERDVRKLALNLASFDAFLCAYTALLSDLHRCTKAAAGFPQNSGWVQFPLLRAARASHVQENEP